MTKVRWRTEDDGTCEILATGHATGSEQVCAGISAIIYSLAGWLKNSDCEVQELTLEPGMARICFQKGSNTEAAGAFAMAVIGLMQIAASNPESCSVVDMKKIF